MTAAITGYDSRYEIWDTGAGPAAFVELFEVIAITPGEASVEQIDATHMQSPGRRREKIAGMIDSGEASVEINWVPGSATDLLIRGLLTSGASVEHRITFPNDVTLTFDAVITGYTKSIPLDDRATATVTVSISGEETWGVAA